MLIRLEAIDIVAPSLARASRAIVAMVIGGVYKNTNSTNTRGAIVAKAVV